MIGPRYTADASVKPEPKSSAHYFDPPTPARTEYRKKKNTKLGLWATPPPPHQTNTHTSFKTTHVSIPISFQSY